MKSCISFFLGHAGAVLAFVLLDSVHAGSATWNLNPTSADWNTAANWTPNTVPNGASDIATLATSQVRSLSIVGNDVEVNKIDFNPGASAFTIAVAATQTLTISGTGIVNNSGVQQNFVAQEDTLYGEGSEIVLSNSATAGTGTFFILDGGHAEDFGTGGKMTFLNASSADHARIDLLGNDRDAFKAAVLAFEDTATAGNSTLTLHPGTGYGANIFFSGDSTAGNAVINNNGGYLTIQNTATAGSSIITLTGHNGYANLDFKGTSADHALITANGGQSSGDISQGVVVFEGGDAANSIITLNGGTGADAAGGVANFIGTLSTMNNATLIVNGGSNDGEGGLAYLQDDSGGGTARVEVFGNGTLDVSTHDAPGVTIGSLEGDGLVLLGANALTVGTNNLATTFAGVISDTDNGALVKTGTGKLTLSGANTYTGGTAINAGTLYVASRRGSATGSGDLLINAGKLGGIGRIAGNAVVGDGRAPEAYLTPGIGGSRPATLPILKSLTFSSDGTFHFGYRGDGTGDKAIARGITINSGAELFFGPIDNGIINVGTIFTVLENSANTAMAGVFANIVDGGTVTVGNNTFRANYEGGDGNDLTLTVVP